jgi:hypothetical protein
MIVLKTLNNGKVTYRSSMHCLSGRHIEVFTAPCDTEKRGQNDDDDEK